MMRSPTLAVLSLLLLTSCNSLARMFRNSPMSMDSAAASSERVNLWPLVYKKGARLAVLWPLYDQDERGFALRPLVARDGSQWDILPPIGFLDTATGNWVCAPAYSLGDSYGLFPLFNRGWINNVGPIWWDEDGAGKITKGGLFPVSRLGPGVNYVGPAWWLQKDDGSVDTGGLLPIVHVSPTFNFAGPAWWWNDATGDARWGGLFPVAWLSPDLSVVGPVWWHSGEDGVDSGGVFPLAHVTPDFGWVVPAWWSMDDTGEVVAGGLFPLADFTPAFSHVGPAFWSRDENGDLTHAGVFPLACVTPGFSYAGPVFWWKDAAGKVEHSGVFPLLYLGPEWGLAGPWWWSDGAFGVFPFATVTDGFSYAGPVWWRRGAGGELDAGGLFPLMDLSPSFSHAGPVFWWRDEQGAVEHFGVFPLAWSGPEFGFAGPVWWTEDAGGLFPVATFTERFSHVGPVFWTRPPGGDEVDRYGLFPVASFGSGLNYVGPAWWQQRPDGTGHDFGLFPLFDVSGDFAHVGPVVWRSWEDGALRDLLALPLGGYITKEDRRTTAFLPLGAAGWSDTGEFEWCNVLGPLFHYAHNEDGDGDFMWVTPLFTTSRRSDHYSWDLWPLIGHEATLDGEGRTTSFTTSGLGGLVKVEGDAQVDKARAYPFYSYRSEHGGEPGIADWTSLVAYKDRGPDGSDLHVMTPLVFNVSRQGDDVRWNSLLWMLDYESKGDTSEFNLLYYLYRQKSTPTETRRDIFPFITLDTGETRSGFSFLWRLLHWERNGDKVGGHVLFIPWGDL